MRSQSGPPPFEDAWVIYLLICCPVRLVTLLSLKNINENIWFLLQGPSTNMIRCRKDGNWTGSLRLCPNLTGQCSLPQNLSPAIHLNCKSGHRIGLCLFARSTSSSLYEITKAAMCKSLDCDYQYTMADCIPVCAGQQERSATCPAEMPAAAWFSCPATWPSKPWWKTTGGTRPKLRCVRRLGGLTLHYCCKCFSLLSCGLAFQIFLYIWPMSHTG